MSALGAILSPRTTELARCGMKRAPCPMSGLLRPDELGHQPEHPSMFVQTCSWVSRQRRHGSYWHHIPQVAPPRVACAPDQPQRGLEHRSGEAERSEEHTSELQSPT